MGQKVHPVGMRLGIIRQHASVWYAERDQYRKQLLIDMMVREYLEKELSGASLSKIAIERPAGAAKITIYTARPGIVIGKNHENIDKLIKELKSSRYMDMENLDVQVEEVREPDADARLVANHVARQLENRVMFRRVLKKAVQNTMAQKVEGVRVQVSGRLGGADIARTEWSHEGRLPLHTLRADIDYATVRASTTYGVIGVKVWICKGEVFETPTPETQEPSAATN